MEGMVKECGNLAIKKGNFEKEFTKELVHDRKSWTQWMMCPSLNVLHQQIGEGTYLPC